MRELLLIALFLWTMSTAGTAETDKPAGSIAIEISGLANEGGMMMVALFHVEDKFLEKPSYWKEIPVQQEGSMEVLFEDIPPGTYAISIYHDLNVNGKLDSNLLMIPKEPIGFSNEYFPKFGPPKFKNASFEFTGEYLKMPVTLRTY